MKKYLRLFTTFLLITPLFCNAQCSDKLGISIEYINGSYNEGCQGFPVGIQLSGIGAEWNCKIYKDTISPSNLISDSTYVNTSLTTVPYTTWYATADSSGCPQQIAWATIVTFPLPTVNISPADTTICNGNIIQFNCGSNGTSYAWSPGIGLFDSTTCNPFAIPLTTTTYTLTVTNSYGCANTGAATITVLPTPPPPNIRQSYDTLYCSTDSSYVSYQWYEEDSLIAGATDTFLVVNGNENYNLVVCNASGCCIAVGMNPCICGINSFSDIYSIKIYPNPATTQLTIHTPSFHNEGVMVSVLNVLGQNASPPAPLQGERGDAMIDVSKLSAGIYFLQMKWESASVVKMFVKE